jgi:hypothetical protein
MRKILAVSLLLLIPCLVWADVRYDVKNQRQNEWPGYCAWAVLETAGNQFNIAALKDRVNRRKAEPDYIEVWYDEAGARHESVVPRNLGSLGEHPGQTGRAKAWATATSDRAT